MTGSDANDGVDVDANWRYAGVEYHSSASFATVCLAWDAAHERTQRDGGYDWDNLHLTGYLVQSKFLDSFRFGIAPRSFALRSRDKRGEWLLMAWSDYGIESVAYAHGVIGKLFRAQRVGSIVYSVLPETRGAYLCYDAC